MFEKYIVTRKAYDADTTVLRHRSENLTRELREADKQKAKLEQQLLLTKSQVGGLEYEVNNLREQLKTFRGERDFAKYLPPVPEGETPRGEYMAQVAGFFEGGLRDKLNYMHLQFRNQTGLFPLSERETDFFRACINVVGLLLDWGEECVAEHRSNAAVANKKSEDSMYDSKDD